MVVFSRTGAGLPRGLTTAGDFLPGRFLLLGRAVQVHVSRIVVTFSLIVTPGHVPIVRRWQVPKPGEVSSELTGRVTDRRPVWSDLASRRSTATGGALFARGGIMPVSS